MYHDWILTFLLLYIGLQSKVNQSRIAIGKMLFNSYLLELKQCKRTAYRDCPFVTLAGYLEMQLVIVVPIAANI